MAILSFAIVLLLLLSFFYINEYRPKSIEDVKILDNKQKTYTIDKDTLSIISWNIGYAGYELSMDFFMDGGSRVRTTKENAEKNLQGIITTLKKYENYDFILLQEVDIASKRSYKINILDSLKKAFPEFISLFAPNFRCSFVPVPFRNPMGEVESGIVILSKYAPARARRHQLPNNETFITRMFNLKRCLLEASYTLPDGDTLSIINTHNSAFDDGTMREKEIGYINTITNSRSHCFISGDWNSNPPGYSPSEEEMSNNYFRPYQMQQSDITNVNYLFDSSGHTMRYLYEPYKKGHTTESLLDFAIATTDIEKISVKTIEEHNYMYSDHNPVCFKIVITHQEAESR